MIFDIRTTMKNYRGLLMTGLLAAIPTLLFTGAQGWGAGEGGAPSSPDPAAPYKIPFPKPDSHRANWLQYHGRTVALTGSTADESGKSCLVCHEKNDCIACHNTRPPRDHTNFWRTRGHGLNAGANPERCSICHRQDYCVRCHNETAPRTHVANWRKRHCTWCHFGSGLAPADNCVVCHKQAPHTSAPHAVSGALNCLSCHP